MEVGVSDTPRIHISVAPCFVMTQMDGVTICTSEHQTGTICATPVLNNKLVTKNSEQQRHNLPLLSSIFPQPKVKREEISKGLVCSTSLSKMHSLHIYSAELPNAEGKALEGTDRRHHQTFFQYFLGRMKKIKNSRTTAGLRVSKILLIQPSLSRRFLNKVKWVK
jgi:hypothetical protein